MFKLLKLLIIVAILAVAGVMFLPLGSIEYRDDKMTAPLSVPSFSIFEEETGSYIARFKTVRSEWALKQEFEKIMQDKYVSHECSDGQIVYYDLKNQITINSYTIESGFPFSTYTIDYSRGNQCQ